MKYFTSTVFQLFLVVGSVINLASAARIRGASSEYRYDQSRHSPGTTHPQTSEVRNSSSSRTDNRKVLRRQLRQHPKRDLRAEKSSSPSPLPTKVPFSEEENIPKQERLDAVTNNIIEKEEKSSSPSPLPTKVAEMADLPPTTTTKSKKIGAKIANKKRAIRNSTVRLPINRRFGDRPFDGNDEIQESNAPFKGMLGRAKPPRDGQNNNIIINTPQNAGPTVVAVVPTSKYVDGDRIAMLGSIAAANPKMAPRIPGNRDRDEKQKKLFVRPIGSSSLLSSLVRAPNAGDEGSDVGSDVGSETTITAPAKNTRIAANGKATQSPTAPNTKSGKKSSKSGKKEDKKSKRSKTDHHKDDNKLTKKQRR